MVIAAAPARRLAPARARRALPACPTLAGHPPACTSPPRSRPLGEGLRGAIPFSPALGPAGPRCRSRCCSLLWRIFPPLRQMPDGSRKAREGGLRGSFCQRAGNFPHACGMLSARRETRSTGALPKPCKKRGPPSRSALLARILRKSATNNVGAAVRQPALRALPHPVLESGPMRASPSGKASASQADIRGFESRCPLHRSSGPRTGALFMCGVRQGSGPRPRPVRRANVLAVRQAREESPCLPSP